jgi:multidrug efflux pump subunit AcrA (membrane-fusion protein)
MFWISVCFLVFHGVSVAQFVVDHGDVALTVVLDGKLVPLKSQSVDSSFEGDILELSEQGSLIETGAVLARLNPVEILNKAKRSQLELEIREKEEERAHCDRRVESLKDGDLVKLREKEVGVQKIFLERAEKEREPVQLLKTELEIQKSRQMIEFYRGHLLEMEALGESGALSKAELSTEKLRLQEYQVGLKQLELEFERFRTGDASEIEIAKRDLHRTRLKLDFANQQRNENKKLRELAVAVSQSEIEELRSKMEEDSKALEQAEIRAPGKGIFLMREHWIGNGYGLYQLGHRLGKGSLLGFIALGGGLKVEFQVKERDLALIRKGQGASFKVLPLGEHWFSGRILKTQAVLREVARWRKDLYALKTGSVEMELLENSPQMKPNMTVLAKVLVQEKKGVLRIPLHCMDEKQRVILLGGKLQPIVPGLIGIHFAEVLKGLKPGQVLDCQTPNLGEVHFDSKAEARREDVFETVSGQGELRTLKEELITPGFTSSIRKLTPSGSEVNEGDLLVLLDIKNIETELKQKEIEETEKGMDFRLANMSSKTEIQGLQQELREHELKLVVEKTEAEILRSGAGKLQVQKSRVRKAVAEAEHGYQDLYLKIQDSLKSQGFVNSQQYQASLESFKNSEIQKRIRELELKLRSSPAPDFKLLEQSLRVRYAKTSRDRSVETLQWVKKRSEHEVALAKLRLDLAQFEVQRLKKRMKNAEIRAIKKGLFIHEDHWAQGKMAPYKVGDNIRPGSVIGKVVEPGSYRIRGRLSEESFHRLAEGQDVEFVLSGRRERLFKGVLQRVSPVPYRTNRLSRKSTPTIQVLIQVKGQSRSFQPGSSVQYEIQVSPPHQGVTIPFLALYENQGSYFVFTSPHSSGSRKVQPGKRKGERIEILSGLSPGDWVHFEGLK